MKISSTQRLRREVNVLPVDKHTKSLGWGTSLSETYNMPKKSRAAREQPSPGPSLSTNAPVAGRMAWVAQREWEAIKKILKP